MYYLVCPVGAVGGKEALLTYSSDEDLKLGQAVEVPFGRHQKTGIIWSKATEPKFKTKPITKAFPEVIPKQLMKLSEWLSQYYAAPLALVLQTVLPPDLGKTHRLEFKLEESSPVKIDHDLTADQNRAIEEIESSESVTTLLHGVTGSGKTRVYLELAKKALSQNKSVIVLVPEIALTPQLAGNFQAISKNVLVLHSHLTSANRHLAWLKLKDSNEPWVVVGPRSALFAPLHDIGLIIIDECHEPSFVQDKHPKYSALRAARTLAELHPGSKLILGSATPLITDYYLAKSTKTPVVELSNTVKKLARLVKIIDARQRENFTKHPFISNKLLNAIEASLKEGNQTLLFHNRRATARVALCQNCGWSAICPNCQVPLRLHHDSHQLRCHICDYHEALPTQCPNCHQPELEFKGFGAKRVEQEIAKLFPSAILARFDSDTPEKEQLHHRYNDLHSGEIDIIIGTQGLAKGLDLPRLSTIGIISSDTELLVPDFSSSERAFQLISQVIGRAGRQGQNSQVFIQTLNPDNFVIEDAKTQNFADFYEHELENRRLGHLPPFTHLLHLSIGYKNANLAQDYAQKMKVSLKTKYPKVSARGPTPAFYAYRAGKNYVQLVVSSQSRHVLLEIANNLPSNWQSTLDPINLL